MAETDESEISQPQANGPAGQVGGVAPAERDFRDVRDFPDCEGILPAAPSPPSPPSFEVCDIFFGADGLRAGWSLLLYFALLAVLLFGSGTVVHKLLHHRAAGRQPGAAAQASPQPGAASLLPPKTVMVDEGVPLFCVVVATWIMGKIERRATRVYGLGGRRGLGNFLAGLGWGVALLSLLVVSLRATGLLVFDARLLFGRGALRDGAVWLALFLLVGLFEECFFRGYLQFTLTRGVSGIYGWLRAPGPPTPGQAALGFWTSAVLLSFGFGLTHRSNAGESPIGLLSVGLVGLVFCLSLWRTGSLWWAIGFHAAWDWAQSFLYGVADSGNMIQGHLFATRPVGRPIYSGGLTGPEGSLFILPILALTAGVIWLTLPRAQYGYRAWAAARTGVD